MTTDDLITLRDRLRAEWDALPEAEKQRRIAADLKRLKQRAKP